ncbi:hypothetical protein FTX61_19290 [Nitriliruptoraceae bacterium ZYF776]|nr:hypothetical protein [Profundirhabdus halotolerans]
MIALSTVGFRTAAFLPGQTAIPAYPDGLGKEDLDGATATVADATRDGGVIVVVVPSWAPEPACRRLETIRCALDTKQLVIHRVDLPPLAGSVFVALADGLRQHVDTPGRLIGALPALAQQVVTLARLTRLSGLRDPSPSIWQHLGSLLPGTAYGVSSFPEPSVRRLKKKKAPLPPLPQLRTSTGMGLAVAVHGGGTTDWAYDQLVPALGHPPVTEVPSAALAPEWWGPGPGVEAVLYPTDIARTAQVVASGVLLRRCGSCGLDSPSDVCPYCLVHEPRPLDEEDREDADGRTAASSR